MNRTRKYDLILFDMDGTLTEVRSPWQYIHERLGLWADDGDRHLKAWLAGEIDYPEFFKRDVDMWLGMSRATLCGLMDEIPLKPGVPEALASLRDAGAASVILSTGFEHMARRIGKVSGLELPVWANVLRFDDGDRLESVDMVTSGDEDSPLSKRNLAPVIMERFGASRERTLAVGDSSGDTGMFEAAGFALGVHGAPDVGQNETLPEPDLRCLLPHVLP
jgi:phosphoserine phosphatase